MTNSLRARTLINLSAVLYEQLAARPSLSAEVSNIDFDFVPGVTFISDVYIANSLRARTLINLSAVSNIDLNFVPSVTFISNVYIADSLRARTLINLSAVLYEQVATQTGLSAEVSNISLRARTLINLSAVLYEQVSIIDLNFVLSVTFDAIGNVELTGDLLGNADRERTASLAKRIKTNEDCKKDNIEELIYVSKVKNNRNNLNIIVTNSTGREFSRVDIKSLTRLCLLIDRAKLYCKRKWAYNISKFYKVISKLDKVPTRELSSHIKTELYPLRDNSRKFYRLVITSKDTHCKQIIKKAYIMSLERALLILFIT
ncbi:hypothetical protein HBI52_197380 [Parastagonospora nodorum]|nr:hypothetical protein HBI52_197380 [Parastagonospora nodorum]